MAESDFGMGYALGADSGGSNNNGGGGMFGGDGWLGLILFAMIFGNGGWGGGGMFGGGGALTRAELYDGFAIQNIDSAVRGVQQGICDSTYAMTNTMTNGFFGVERGLWDISRQSADCCCQTQRLMERGFCDLGNAIGMQTRDIIDNQNANYRSLFDFMVQEKLSSKDAQIAQLQNRLSQSEQNGVIRAAIDASTAEIIRRTGNECPVPAYVVPNPNCCYGNPLGVGYSGYGYSRDSSCGCGC